MNQEKTFSYSSLIRPVVLLFAIFQIFVFGFFVGYGIKLKQEKRLFSRFTDAYQIAMTNLNKGESPSSNPTPPPPLQIPEKEKLNDWKSYTNKNLGISLKYPATFQLKEEKPDSLTYRITITADGNSLVLQNIVEGTVGGDTFKGTEQGIIRGYETPLPSIYRIQANSNTFSEDYDYIYGEVNPYNGRPNEYSNAFSIKNKSFFGGIHTKGQNTESVLKQFDMIMQTLN